MRYTLKNSFKRLKGERAEEHFDNLRALSNIDPFKHLYAYALLLLVFLFTGYYRAIGVLIIVYLIWTLMFWIAFYGVKRMYEKSVQDQEFEDVIQKNL